ncbi:HEAT repeat domain-containing protein, partial [Bacteroides eggerthii]|nr:HEAT repeat domain-containing protein [Bacteroides eggerthii]
YAVEYVEKNCNPELLPAWIESYLLRGHENRHRFRIFSAINTFDHDMALNELKKQAADWSFYDSSYVNELLEYFPRQKKGLERDFALIGNPESTTKQIQSEISRFRNKPITKAIDPLLNIIKNESQEEELRIAAAETLGWYNLYHDKTSIIKELETFQTSKKKVMNEIVKTINRLKGKNR